MELETPRDRAGTFEPQIVRKGQRRLDGIDKIVLGLYAKGMSTRDITAHLAEIYDVDGLTGPDQPRSPTRCTPRSPSGSPARWTGSIR